MDKDDGAFLTIGELARDLGVAQHILRYWETRFSQLRPLQRSGNRRYYRPADVAVAQHIKRLLNDEGFTVRGAQRVLAARIAAPAGANPPAPAPAQIAPAAAQPPVAAPVTPLVTMAPRVQGELPIAPSPSMGTPVRPPAQVGDSDIALLIARLTVIRQNLLDAIEPADAPQR